VVQYVVEEAVEAGIEEIIFITSSNKRALEDHFDYNFELEYRLKESGKEEQYQQIRAISDMARFVYVRQKEQKGTGHAILTAKDLIGDEPFLVLWGDEFLVSQPSRSQQLVKAFQEKNAPIITVIKTDDPDDTNKYGYIKADKDNGLLKVLALIEKPGPEKVPSNLASVGGFILTPDIFPIIEKLPAKNGEIWLADAINQLCQQRPVFAQELVDATYYDSGSKFGFIKANIDFGLKHPETREPLLEYIKQLRDA
jgi:UTP--glucose-1-phosphate uridylyltransferase